eukprot:2180123-Rhodomonas_salina.1
MMHSPLSFVMGRLHLQSGIGLPRSTRVLHGGTNSRHQAHGLRGSEVCGRSRVCSSSRTALRALAAAAAGANALLALACTGAAKVLRGVHLCCSSERTTGWGHDGLRGCNEV